MSTDQGKWQWELSVTVYHGPSFGHRVELVQSWAGRVPVLRTEAGSWRGLGIPSDVLQGLRATVDAIISEHLSTRYGLAEGLPLKWGGEPDPF